MEEHEIKELLGYKYWPVVDIENQNFIAKLYRLNKSKEWRQIKSRSFKTPFEAWEFLITTLNKTLKFVK